MVDKLDALRHPRTYHFLAWLGPRLLAAAAAIAALLAAFAQIFDGVRDWIEQTFYRAQPAVSAPGFWISFAIVILIYIAALIWTSQPLPPATHSRQRFREASLRRKEETLLDIMYGRSRLSADTGHVEPYSPILFAGIEEAKDTPLKDHSAIRVIVRNQSGENLHGLVARLVSAAPPLDGLEGAVVLPLVLETKSRLDRHRNPAINEPIPQDGFSLHAHSDQPVEIVWLHSKGALEGHVTHEAGEALFLFVGTQELRIEVTGAGPPIAAVLKINVADDDIQSWKPELIVEASVQMHGAASLRS